MNRRVGLLALLAVACESPFGFTPPASAIAITPDSATVETGDTVRLGVTVTDSAGRPLTRPVTWSSSADSIATVSRSGVVVAYLPGTVTITATADGLSARVTLHIAPKITAVLVDQGDLTLGVGGAATFTASTLDAQGDQLVGRPVTWASGDSTILEVSATGRVVGLRTGATTLTASHGAVSRSVAVAVRALRFIALRAGPADHTCGLTDDDVAFCWGANDLGQLALPNLSQSASPVASPHTPTFAAVTAGATFSCGARVSGSVYCWGSSARGRLGAGVDQVSTATPVLVSDSLAMGGLVSGWNHTCGLANGVLICWGENPGAGGTTPITWTPAAVPGSPALSALAASVGFGCGLTGDGSPFCWGTNGAGQLGNGSLAATPTPTAVAGGLRFVSLAAGWTHACGLTGAGVVYCWGGGGAGQLGTGDTIGRLTPVALAGAPAFASIAAGGSRTCGLTPAGTAYCWGDGVLTPTAVAGAPTFTSLTVGNAHACGLGTDGRAYCWGRNNRGQLGDGTLTDRAEPAPVLGQP